MRTARGLQRTGVVIGMKSLALFVCAALPVLAPPTHTGSPPRGVRAAVAGYDPCAGKSCGDPCHACPPDEPACVETAVLKFCGAQGACAPARPVCE